MKNLFVGNLPFQMSGDEMEQNLRAAFEAFGGASVISDRETGKPRGFALVEMEDDDSAASKAVAALNGTDFHGRALNVSEARPRTDREGGGMGRRWPVWVVSVVARLPRRVSRHRCARVFPEVAFHLSAGAWQRQGSGPHQLPHGQ